jgi:hypothetical protein
MASPLLDAASASAVDGTSTMASVTGVGSGAAVSESAGVGAASTGVELEAGGGASGVSDVPGASPGSRMVNGPCYALRASKHTCLTIITLIVNHLLNSRVVEYWRRRHYPPIYRLFLWCGCCRSIEVLRGVGSSATVRIRPRRYRDIRKLAHGVSSKSMRCLEIEGLISCATCYI